MFMLYICTVCLGGETIREINRQSGAHVELSRNQPPNPRERVFRVAGNPDQIQGAIRMMSEKAGVVSILGASLWYEACLIHVMA